MERDLKDKVVVVTGGAMGIGFQIAKHFLMNGAKTIIILDILESTGVEAAKTLNEEFGEGKAVYIKCDVTTDLEAVSTEILKNYEVDVFINNAAVLDETSIRRTVDVNVVAAVEWGMKFWDNMRKDNGGSGGTIINMSSMYGYVNDPWLIYYKTSKHAIIGFTKTLGHEYTYNNTGVRVFAICPGFTHTNFLHGKLFKYHEKDTRKFFNTLNIQKVETVGQAAVDMFKIAESGTGWAVHSDQPIEQAPI